MRGRRAAARFELPDSNLVVAPFEFTDEAWTLSSTGGSFPPVVAADLVEDPNHGTTATALFLPGFGTYFAQDVSVTGKPLTGASIWARQSPGKPASLFRITIAPEDRFDAATSQVFTLTGQWERLLLQCPPIEVGASATVIFGGVDERGHPDLRVTGGVHVWGAWAG